MYTKTKAKPTHKNSIEPTSGLKLVWITPVCFIFKASLLYLRLLAGDKCHLNQ